MRSQCPISFCKEAECCCKVFRPTDSSSALLELKSCIGHHASCSDSHGVQVILPVCQSKFAGQSINCCQARPILALSRKFIKWRFIRCDS